MDLDDEMQSAWDAAVVRLVVQKQNPSARTFWEKQGCTLEEEVIGKVGRLESPAWKMLLRFAGSETVMTQGAGT